VYDFDENRLFFGQLLNLTDKLPFYENTGAAYSSQIPVTGGG
jgi:hypothetical protein